MAAARVKICCISSPEEARLAIGAGASALGLVSAMPSGPGVIDEAVIAEIAAAVPPGIATFLLTCLQDADAIVAQHARCRTSVLQLVDHVPESELRALRRALPGVGLVQVIHVRAADSFEEARAAAPFVDALLLDSGNPSLAVKELGGTGRVHDWQVSRRIRDEAGKPVYLAGGLHAGNVAQAIAVVQPFGLDICSGVRAEGRLDRARLEAFVAAARGTHQRGVGLVSIVVRDYDEAIAFYVGVLGFSLVEDTPQPAEDKRWVVVAPPGGGCRLLLGRARDAHQAAVIGNQAGGRVFLFLYTDDLERDRSAWSAAGVEFVRPTRSEAYGKVTVFRDLYGNLWDLVEPSAAAA